MAGSALDDRRLVARTGAALVLASARYFSNVGPLVRGELRRWETRAQAIENPELRALALGKLASESFNAEAGAMLATLAPREHRRHAVEGIVALELLFDYLDGLTERPSSDPMRDGECLFGAFTDAFDPRSEDARGAANERCDAARRQDGGYLEALSAAVQGALAELPGAAAIARVAQASASRSAQAQVRMHASSSLGTTQLEEWAASETPGTGLQWRELLAGAASSVLALHALIVASAATDTTREDAARIEAAYLSTCAVLTLLDSVVDLDADRGTGERGYISFYDGGEPLAQTLAGIARRAASQARALPNGSHHVAMLIGVVAYYGSAPGAHSELARPTLAAVQDALSPLSRPTLAMMRIWRLTKRARLRPQAAAVDGRGARN